MKKILLEIKNLKKIYHNKQGETLAVDNVNFDVYQQEILAIVGPSGCGKSTILSILSDLNKKSDGKIVFHDKEEIGYMLQTDSLFPWLTILDNCLLGLEIKKRKNPESIKNVIRLLDKYGLSEFKYKYPDSLSGGMKQRVALIRTLAINPSLLLLDEPYSALDYQTRLALSDDMYRIIKAEKKTAILITHDIAEAISMSDRVIVLSRRPANVKSIYEIKLNDKKNPIHNRKCIEFNDYYEKIWRDLDVYLQWRT